MSNILSPIGAIVRAWFPESESVLQPGPKFRPVLVLDVQKRGGQSMALVAYGTSQRTDRFALGEVVVRKSHVPSLESDTKFCLTKAIWLPLSEDYFKSNGRQPLPTRLPAELLSQLYRACKESGLLD